MEKAGTTLEALKDAQFALSTPSEKRLALQLLEFPGAVVRAAEAYKPSVLADYLFQTAQLYSTFYQGSPVLKPAFSESSHCTGVRPLSRDL